MTWRFQPLYHENNDDAGGGGGAGGAGNPGAGAPPDGAGGSVGAPPGGGAGQSPGGSTEVPWAEFLAKHTEPDKVAPYKNAKTWKEAFDTTQQRLAEAQTALRARPAGATPRPAADAPAEAHAAWRAANGIPETPEGYGLTRPEAVPEAAWDAEGALAFQRWAHEKGLPPQVVKDIAAWDAERQISKAAALQAAAEAHETQLKASETQALAKLYGSNVDSTLKELQSVVQASGKDPSVFDPNSPKFWGVEAVETYQALVKMIPRAEDGTARAMGTPSPGGMYDKAWAKATLQPTHPDYAALNNPKDPRHAELTRLKNLAYATG